MESCACDAGLSNLGYPSCSTQIKVARAIYIVPTYDSTGVRNKVTVATEIDDAFLLARVNDADKSKRWFPLQKLETVTPNRADPTYETAPSNRKAFVKVGVKTWSADKWEGGSVLAKALDSIRCNDVSVFIVDAEGKLVGMDKEDTGVYLYPIKTDKESWYVKVVDATDTTIEKLNISFDWSITEYDTNLRYVVPTADMFALNGLVDIATTVTNITTTGFKAKLFTKNGYGDISKKIPLTGMLLADFALYNVTDSLAVTISSVVESPDGTYTFAFVAQTSADVLRLTPSLDGYEFTDVIATVITIP